MEETIGPTTQQQKPKQYEKYKPTLKRTCIFNVAASVCAILGFIFLLFIPFFVIKGSAETVEITESGISVKDTAFSLFDEIKASFSLMSGGSSGGDAYKTMAMMYSFYQIIAIVCLCVGIVLVLVSLGKNITAILNPDDYALEEYDKIKRGTGKSKKRLYASSAYWFSSALVLEIFYIIMNRMMSGMMSNLGASESEAEEVTSTLNGGLRLASCDGVNGWIVFCILFYVAFIALTALVWYWKKQVKMSILKEDYGVSA